MSSETSRWGWLESVLRDAAYGMRSLRRQPVASALVVLTLALGIGGNTAIFTLLNTLLLKPLPYADSDRLVTVLDSFARLNIPAIAPTVPEAIEIGERVKTLENTAFFDCRDLQVIGPSEPYRVFAARVTASLFPLLGVQAAQGRTFLGHENSPGSDSVVVLSDAFWRRAYNAGADAIGAKLLINGTPHTVVGVLPSSFSFDHPGLGVPEPIDLFVPYPLNDAYIHRTSPFANQRRVQTIGRVKAGSTLHEAESEISAFADQLSEQYPQTYRRGAEDLEFDFQLTPLRETIVGRTADVLNVMFGAVALILLIGCANTAQFLLARSIQRSSEIAIRTSVGATPVRLVRQLVTEGLVLGIVSGVLGLGLSMAIVRVVTFNMPLREALLDDVQIDLVVLGFASGLVLLTTVMVAVFPAVQASRRGYSQRGVLGDKGAGRNWQRHALLVLEVALSMVLLVAAGVLLRGLLELSRAPRGFSPENVTVMQLRLPPQRAQAARPIASVVYKRYLEEIALQPGVESAAIASGPPVQPIETVFAIENRPVDPAAVGRQTAAYHIVSPEYFVTLRIPLLQGRAFTADDTIDRPEVAIVNQELVRRQWPGENPVGQRIRVGSVLTVVGVVGNVRTSTRETAPIPQIYVPSMQHFEPNAYIAVRQRADAGSVSKSVQDAVRSIVPDQPLFNIRSMEDVLETSLATHRFNATIIGGFAGLAVLMSAAGVFSVVSYIVSQRKREVAIRLALGARPGGLFGSVAGRTLAWIAVGIGIGLVGGLGVTRVMGRFVTVIVPPDALTLSAMLVFYVVLAMSAVLIPLRKAFRPNLVKTLQVDE